MFTVLGLARVRGEAAASLFCVLLYQCCYSAAPVYLSHVAASVPGRQDMARAILVFVALYFLPYPLAYAAALWRVLWMSSARRAFYEKAYRRGLGRVAGAMDRDAEASFAALISANGQSLVADCLYFVNGTASLMFSSTLSVTLISLFVLNGFAAAYLVSAVLCALIIWRLGAWQVRMSAASEKAYNRLIAALPQAWLANALGESTIVDRFLGIFARRWRLHRRVALRAINAFQAFDLLQAVCIWVPAAAVIALQLPAMEVSGMIALAVVLPRLTETLLDISALVSNLTDYLALRGRVAWLEDALRDRPVALAQRCDFARLALARRGDAGWEPIAAGTAEAAAAATAAPGRYRLSGANGAGKTTLLLMLKMRGGAASFYLPAQTGLFPAIGSRGSTGQRRLADLRRSFALMDGTVKTLLLDEWDANLDPANRQRISGLIDELARSHAVIEVSHGMAGDHERPLTSSG